jgi:hypothetical protein
MHPIKQGFFVQADTLQKRPAFDHEKLAAALTAALAPEKAFTSVTLPFTTFTFVDGDRTIELTANETTRSATPLAARMAITNATTTSCSTCWA